MSSVIALANLKSRLVIFPDGSSAKITNLFDGDGEDTESLADAVSAVAGPDRFGQWLAFALADIEQVTIH